MGTGRHWVRVSDRSLFQLEQMGHLPLKRGHVISVHRTMISSVIFMVVRLDTIRPLCRDLVCLTFAMTDCSGCHDRVDMHE